MTQTCFLFESVLREDKRSNLRGLMDEDMLVGVEKDNLIQYKRRGYGSRKSWINKGRWTFVREIFCFFVFEREYREIEIG